MKIIRTIYKITRGILFTAIILVAVVYLAIYILVSVPSFQNAVKDRVARELSAMIGSDVKIGSLNIHPFNEIVVRDIEVADLEGERCLYVETLGAGVHLWRLMSDRKVVLTYAEVIGLDARITQRAQDAPLNIQFIIDAFKPKDKNKPPAIFDLNFRNVVLRRCSASFDREWIPALEDSRRTDFNHLRLRDLKADLNLPRISNDDIRVDLRRLSFSLSGGLEVETIAFKAHVTQKSLSLRDFKVKLPGTELTPSDVTVTFDSLAQIADTFMKGDNRVVFVGNQITPSDFSWLCPDMSLFPESFFFSADVSGNIDSLELSDMSLVSADGDMRLSLSASARMLSSREDMSLEVSDFRFITSSPYLTDKLARLRGINQSVVEMIAKLGSADVLATGSAFPSHGRYTADLCVKTAVGNVAVSARSDGLKGGRGVFDGEISAEDVDCGILSGDNRWGNATAEFMFAGKVAGREVDGDLTAVVSSFEYGGVRYDGLTAVVGKEGKDMDISIDVDNNIAEAHLEADGHIDGAESWMNLYARVGSFRPDLPGLLPAYEGYRFSGVLNASLEGDTPDNLIGEIRLNDAGFKDDNGKGISLSHLMIKGEREESVRTLTLRSDWIDGVIKGDFIFKELPVEVKSMLCSVFPGWFGAPPELEEGFDSDVEFSFLVKANNTLPEFFSLPFRLLVDIPITGSIDGTGNSARMSLSVPYLQQGKNKLVRDTRLALGLDGESGNANVNLSTTVPAKKGDVSMSLSVLAQSDKVFADLDWVTPSNSAFNGKLSLDAEIAKNMLSGTPDIKLDITPSSFDFGPAHWNIDRSSVSYEEGALNVENLRIWHEKQFVEIGGTASSAPLDSLSVKLADIDLGYIFDTLNINYVTFGGTATGEITAKGALSGNPEAFTERLSVKELSYNGAVLGDGELKSRWHNEDKKVSIYADIMGEQGNLTTLDGGIWVTRDSLSFAIDADRVPVGFLGPFMSAFTTDVKGHASGKAKLFGTFSDIDLVGRILADSVAMRLDYTNVYYHGTDSVILDPGRIVIPSFRLYDKYGNSAILSGELTHRYFHDPRFTFRISDVRRMLCYDTNSRINPDWYGTIFGNGSAVVRGWPGGVSVSVDMTAVGNSNFTFVLNDTQAAEDYRFLTFSDRKKEEREKEMMRADSLSSVLASFRKKMDSQNSTPSKFMIDIRGSVSPSTLMTLVMDPVAGDKITARGNGNIQVDYDSESEEMQMFGKYILEEGNYNFSLQDLILRDFTIRQGSSISFNGDPLNARLDITAAYRVNTNLSDLDKSFSTDRDLARTNVPVDAMLMVEGDMQHPDITFDIELPTLTQDVERKVKSIISTDDMMSRQIIYLLALNRFYTPEYMGATSNGGEFASMASSTLSSQLSNMLGQLTDKFTVAPSFRSDKGDFSDLEVDVALSSRLLNNRLLINGNFGYRDRSTSQTTFVGDFDIEYLLSRSGNLRLKAYNHFNDQNYYLRQALTTQGLGVIYRKDFDNPFTFLRRRKKDDSGEREKKETTEPGDSIGVEETGEMKK